MNIFKRYLPFYSFIFLSLLLFLGGCDIVNPDEEIPSYIHVRPFNFVQKSSQEGTADQKITEVWLTADGEFLGAYDLPATIPILKSGDVNIRLEAGIRDNGISTLPEIYPFFEPFERVVALQPAEVDTIQPVTSYQSDVVFGFVEDFERSGSIFNEELDGDTATVIVNTTTEVFEGNRSGLIQLDTGASLIKVATDFDQLFSELQSRKIFVYLELNYKTEAEIAFGLIGHDGNSSIPREIFEPILFPNEAWNKIYLNLSEVAFTIDSEGVQVVLLSGLSGGQASARVLIDNVKLLYF